MDVDTDLNNDKSQEKTQVKSVSKKKESLESNFAKIKLDKNAKGSPVSKSGNSPLKEGKSSSKYLTGSPHQNMGFQSFTSFARKDETKETKDEFKPPTASKPLDDTANEYISTARNISEQDVVNAPKLLLEVV